MNPASAYSASAAPRCAGSAAATAPPASAPTSAKLVICTRTNNGRTIRIGPPAVAANPRQVATETRQMPMMTVRRPCRAATSAISMLTGTPASEATPETTPGAGRVMWLPGRLSHEPDPHCKDLPGIAGESRHIGDQGAIAEQRTIRWSPPAGFPLDQGSR